MDAELTKVVVPEAPSVSPEHLCLTKLSLVGLVLGLLITKALLADFERRMTGTILPLTLLLATDRNPEILKDAHNDIGTDPVSYTPLTLPTSHPV